MKITVSTSNFYVGNSQPAKDAKFLASLGAVFSGVQEGHSGNAHVLGSTLWRTHHVFWKQVTDKDLQKAYEDTAVVVPRIKGVKVLRFWSRLISKRSSKRDIGMPRSATVARL